MHKAISQLTRKTLQRRFDMTTLIFAGLAGGIFLGLFLGESAAHLKPIGDVYIGLMQMTVLPYIVFSLIGNIGRLSAPSLRVLTGTALMIYLVMWAFAALTVLLVSQSFPELETGSFFSSSLVDPPPRLDLINLFIPSNPFRSLADNSVPAVVIFCILFGIALVGFEDKSSLLGQVGLIAKTLHRVNGMVVKLTPLGVFAVATNAAGTMTFEQFERLQGYYFAFIICVLLMIFGVLPLLVTACTSIRYREVLAASRNAVLAAFVTGSILSVIPLLIDGVNGLLAPQRRTDSESADFPALILPLAYPFPNCGNVVSLLFIPFAAWFIGDKLGLNDELLLFGLGFFVLFGKVFLAIPLLLNTFQLPQDMFQLFLTGGVLAGRLGDALGSMHFMVFTTLSASAMMGRLQLCRRTIVRNLGIILLMILLAMFVTHGVLGHFNRPEIGQVKILSETTLIDEGYRTPVIVAAGPNPQSLRPGQNRLQRIRERGIIRVGFLTDNLPYSFMNGRGVLVGFDVDLAIKLARDLGVGVEFVPFERASLIEQLNQDHFDVALSGLTVTLQRSGNMLMTQPYLIVHMGMVIRDYQRSGFESEDLIARKSGLRLGVIEGSFFEETAHRYFPGATIIPLASPREFFEDMANHFDAMVSHAESGAAWTLIYPSYSVVNPFKRRTSAPVSMVVGGFDVALGDALNTWIGLQRMEGTIDQLFEYWMQGIEPAAHKRRWSILRDVLHWEP